MTIIVYRNGWCYSDELIFQGDLIIGRAKKIAWRKRDGAIIASSGSSPSCQKFIDSAMAKKMVQDNGTTGEHGCNGLVFRKDGMVEDYTGVTACVTAGDFFATGCAHDVAIGALVAGLSAKDACRAACNAMGWVTGLHGVNHDGAWDFVEWSDGFKQVHGEHRARDQFVISKTGVS